MPSVLGLLEAREKKVREEVSRLNEEAERVRAALTDAENVLASLAGACETVAEVLARGPAERGRPARTVAPGSTVPQRVEGVGPTVLAPEYQQILQALASPEAADGMRARQLAVRLGLQAVPAKVEGVRSRMKRLVTRGWAAEPRPGVF